MSRPEEIVLCVARADWYRDHLQRAYPNWRDREGDLARLAEIASRAREPGRLPRRPPARRAGRGRRGRLGPGAPGGAVEHPPGQGPRVAGRVRPAGGGRLVPLRLGGQRGQPRRGGAALLRGGHAGRRRALPLPADRRAARVGHRGGRPRAELGPGLPRPRPRRRWSRSGRSAEGLRGWAGRDSGRQLPPERLASESGRLVADALASAMLDLAEALQIGRRRRRGSAAGGRGRPRRPPARPAREDARSPPCRRGPWPTRPGPSPPPSCRPSSSASTSTRCWRRST